MNWPIRFLIPLFLILAAAQIGRLQAEELDDDRDRADLSRLVIVGDSISAGHQNSCLLDTQQPNSYASLLARQARVDLPLPLMDGPGLPPCLELVSLDPLIIERSSIYPGLRIDPTVQAYNLSVPGMRIVDALKKIPDDEFHGLFDFPFSLIHQQVVLGHPGGLSQIDIAERLMPTTVVLWLGSNDVLWALIGANPAAITPEEYFQYAFQQVLSRLVNTGATVVVGNVPSINTIPFATPAEDILAALSESTGYPAEVLAILLGIGPGDFVTLPGLPLIEDILQVQGSETLPDEVVLTAEEAAQIQAAVDTYNAFISREVESLRAGGFPVALVDADAMLRYVQVNGLRLGHRKLTTDFLGGIFTLDGIHPTNTAHAIIANGFINVLNSEFDARIRPIPVGRVFRIMRRDPLVPEVVDRDISEPRVFAREIVRSLKFIRDPIMAP